jgi:hypothetical protein
VLGYKDAPSEGYEKKDDGLTVREHASDAYDKLEK